MNIEKAVQTIQDRNRRVEADKAWETSIFRVLTITAMTYVIAVIFMYLVNIENAWLNAFVPAGGYFLSTRSLPFIKRWWIKKYLK